MSLFSPDRILALVSSHPIVPVFYHADINHAQQIVQACFDGGLRVFEFTNRGDKALDVFGQLIAYVRENCIGMALGIGTILTADEAEDFIRAGADFVVQPITTGRCWGLFAAYMGYPGCLLAPP